MMISKILSFVIAISFSCTHAMFLFQTPFSSKFSLRELVDRSKTMSALDCKEGAGGGGASSSMFAGGKSTSHYSKSEDLSCKRKDDGDLDEADLMKALSQTVEQDLKEAGAKIVEYKMHDASSFYFNYELNNLTGKIQISGRSTGNYYSLSATIAENRGE